MRQAELLTEDEPFRQRIIANAKEYVDANYNEKVEFQAYSKMARDMCRSVTTKNENAEDQSDNDAELDRKVRFQCEKKKCKVTTLTEESAVESLSGEKLDTTEEAQSSEQQSEERKQAVENETRHEELEENANATWQPTSGSKKTAGFFTCNVIPPDGEEKNPETFQIPSKADSTPEKEEKQSAKTDGGEDCAADKVDGDKQPSEKLGLNPVTETAAASTTPSPRGLRFAAVKTDARKRTTDSPSRPTSEKNSPPAAVGKGRGTAGKNGQKQPVTPTMSDSGKKTATTTLKKAPLYSTQSADKALLKPRSAHSSAARSVSDTGIGSRPASRSQKTKK